MALCVIQGTVVAADPAPTADAALSRYNEELNFGTDGGARVRLTGSAAADLNGFAASAQAVAAAAGLKCMGYNVRETQGVAAVFEIRHGTSNAGPLVCPVRLNPNESSREFWPGGINTPNGIWVKVVSGGPFDLVMLSQ